MEYYGAVDRLFNPSEQIIVFEQCIFKFLLIPLIIELPQVIQSRNALNHCKIIVGWKLNKFFVESLSRMGTGVTEKIKQTICHLQTKILGSNLESSSMENPDLRSFENRSHFSFVYRQNFVYVR